MSVSFKMRYNETKWVKMICPFKFEDLINIGRGEWGNYGHGVIADTFD